MPDVKISGLPVGTVTSTSLVPAVSGGATHQTTPLASTQAALTSLAVYTGTNTVSIGSAIVAAGPRLRVYGPITGAAAANAVMCDCYVAPDVTSTARMFLAYPSTAAGAFTVTQLVSFYSGFNGKGAGSTITNHIGFLAESSMTQATNNFGFHGNIAANTGCWNLFMAGTAQNYFGGRVGIGTTTPGSALEVTPGTMATQGINCLINGAASQVIYAVMAQAAGPAASNTGLYVNVTSATSTNYGIRIINPPAGANNWAIYSDSAAQSYHIGNIGIGTGITVPTSPLDVGGSSIRIRTTSTQATSAAAGNVGEIRWDDTYLYVRISSGWRRVALGAAF